MKSLLGGAALLSTVMVHASALADESLERRVEALEARRDELRAAAMQAQDDWTSRIRVGGYIQPMLIWQTFNAAASPNVNADGRLPPGVGPNSTIATPAGTTTNPDYFRIRRARLFALASLDFLTVMFEIEPLLRGGPILGTGTIARNVYVTGTAHLGEATRLELGIGQFNVPFGWDVLQPNSTRPFIDEAYVTNNLFPGDFDLGAFANLFTGKLTVTTAVLNGLTLGEKNYAVLPDMNRGKDVLARASYDFGPIDAGVSGYVGSGSLVDAANLRFKQYGRWAANVELALHQELSHELGQTKAFAELTYAQNMDRGTNIPYALPSIPNDVTKDVVNKHELGGFLRVEQDATRWLTLGVRYDYYTPDISLPDDRRHTFSGVAAFHFTKALQLMAEYDSALDRIHPASGVPVTNTIKTFSLVLQGRLL